MLGRGASLFRDGEGNFTQLPARALEACFRADVEVVIFSGRRRAQVHEDARLIGQSSFIFEIGAGFSMDREITWLTDMRHKDIERTGAPARLMERFDLEHHDPWHTDREVSHLFRGSADVREADELLAADELRLVDNGAISRGHAYHLVPARVSKRSAVGAHMQARGYAREDTVGIGDSEEDAEVAEVVGRFFLVTEPATGFYEAVVEALMT